MIECFNCGGLRHVSSNCSSPKDIKKLMQATWSDTKSNEKDPLTPRDHKYDRQDYFPFIASIGFDRDVCSDCNSDSNDNASILDNLCEEY